MSLHCNRCQNAFEGGGGQKATTTACGHLFCTACMPLGFTSDFAQCPKCGDTLSKSQCKLAPVLANASDIKMTLYGQTPEAIMETALEGIRFFNVQQQVLGNTRERLLADKAIQIRDQCSKKLTEVHNAYQNAKRKYVTLAQEKMGLEQETKELQEKYRQKSKQNQELQRMYKELQSRQQGGPGSVGGAMMPHPQMGGMSPPINNGGPHMGKSLPSHPFQLTTVQRTHVYNLGGMSPEIRGNNGVPSLGYVSGSHRPSHQSLSPGMLSPGLNGQGTSVQQRRNEMFQQLPGGPGGGQPAKLMPGGAIGRRHSFDM